MKAPPQRLHGKRRRVVILPDAHPAAVVGHVIDPIRYRLAELLIDKIVHLDPFRLSPRTPLSPTVAKFPTNSFFLVSTDTDRLPQPLKCPHPPDDLFELRIAVGMLVPFQRLAVGLQTVANSCNSRFTVRSLTG